LLYFYSNKNIDVALEKIPNGKVNIKPELPIEEGSTLFPEANDLGDADMDNVKPELPIESESKEKNWNTKMAEPESPIIIEAIDPCYAIVGSFLNHQNSERLKIKLESKGYQVQLFPYQSYMRVGIHMDCLKSDSILTEIRKNIHKDAWIFK
jgi:hypothetical protein